MRRSAPLLLFALAAVLLAVAFVSMLTTEIDVRESLWVTGALLATTVAFFLKELR